MTLNLDTGENRHLVPVDKILIDGEDVSDRCRIASEEEGYVVLFVREGDKPLQYRVDPQTLKLVRERREGTVKIVLR